eukprot:758417-Hanusia_phi.AAC.7
MAASCTPIASPAFEGPNSNRSMRNHRTLHRAVCSPSPDISTRLQGFDALTPGTTTRLINRFEKLDAMINEDNQNVSSPLLEHGEPQNLDIDRYPLTPGTTNKLIRRLEDLDCFVTNSPLEHCIAAETYPIDKDGMKGNESDSNESSNPLDVDLAHALEESNDTCIGTDPLLDTCTMDAKQGHDHDFIFGNLIHAGPTRKIYAASARKILQFVPVWKNCR